VHFPGPRRSIEGPFATPCPASLIRDRRVGEPVGRPTAFARGEARGSITPRGVVGRPAEDKKQSAITARAFSVRTNPQHNLILGGSPLPPGSRVWTTRERAVGERIGRMKFAYRLAEALPGPVDLVNRLSHETLPRRA